MAIEFTSDLALVLGVVTVLTELIAVLVFPKLGWTKLRRLPALDGVFEAVHICAEKGQPLFHAMGYVGPVTYASSSPGFPAWCPAVMALVKSLATECAKVGVTMHAICYHPIGTMMARDFMKEGYFEGGRADMYAREMVEFAPTYQVGVLQNLEYIGRNKPGAAINIGAHWWGTMLTLVEAEHVQDSFIVSGTVYPADNAAAAIASDVATFGEENLAIGAYLDDDPLSSSALAGEDIIKIGLIAVCVLAGILAIFGVTI
jgi:hypothetical protein